MLGRLGPLLDLPEIARVVLIVRHPCGQVASMLRQIDKEGPGSTLAASALPDSPMGRRRGLTTADLAEMPPVDVLAWKWLAFNEAALEAIADHDKAIVIAYDTSLRDMDTGLTRLFDFLNLDIEQQTRDFVAKSTSDGEGAGYYSLRRDPAKAATRWQTQPSPDQIARIESIVTGSQTASLFGIPAANGLPADAEAFPT